MDEDNVIRIISIVVFVAIIAGMAAGAYWLKSHRVQPKQTQIVYNNFYFVRDTTNNFWGTQWQNNGRLYELQFRYLPNETLDVPIDGQINQSFFNSTIYITFNPSQSNLQNMTLAVGELSLNLARGLDYDIAAACTQNATGCENRPIVTCEKNQTVPVIYLVEKEQTKVTLSGNCMVLQGQGRELLRSVDRILYVWYKIVST
ncbi:MAG: hypothetical protein EPN86_00795 [Nanoarchaeota archaeon]|nr:MAG: hypothetical protein EPN86_00795 [Nanoarchaeota archaeon]